MGNKNLLSTLFFDFNSVASAKRRESEGYNIVNL